MGEQQKASQPSGARAPQASHTVRPNIRFGKNLLSTLPSFQSHTSWPAVPNQLRPASAERTTLSSVGGGQRPPFRASAQALLCKLPSPKRGQGQATPVPPSLLQQPRKRIPSRGRPTAAKPWKLCRLRLWNSSTGRLQLIITAP